MKRGIRFRAIASVLIAGAITLLSWAGLSADVFFGTQLRLSDALYPSGGADPRIAVVAIDDRSLAEVGEQWPWGRSLHAQIVDRLAADGAFLIGYDVTFSEPGRDPAGDQALADAVETAGNVVLAANAIFEGKPGDLLSASELDLPIDDLAAASAAIGHSNVFPDADGVVRSLPPVIEGPSRDLVPSLSFSLFQLQTGAPGPVTIREDGFQTGGEFVPTGPAHLMDVNFVEGFQTFSAVDVIEGNVEPGTFEGRIVLVGATAIGLGDLRLTPLDKAGGQPGVLVHANALQTMLRGAYVFPEGQGATVAWVFLIALLVAVAVAFLRVWLSPLVAIGLLVGFFALAFNRFDGGRIMNLVYPPLGAVLAFIAALAVRYFTEFRERQRVTQVFGRYLAKDVVEEVLASPKGALATLEGASRPLAVLFADLRGFTAASEAAPPEDVVAALNVYLDGMTRAVVEERGTIDKFMGDCVMAFWGAPRRDPEYVTRAVRAAKRMQDYLDEAMKSGAAARLKVKGCGVGISAGQAVVGNIGSTERLDYTAIGDTVNTASRLCGVAEAGQIIVTEDCLPFLGPDVRLGNLPPLVVKGKARPLRVYEVLREGQEAREVAEGEIVAATEDKGHFEEEIVPAAEPFIRAPTRAAGYAPVEPVPDRTPASPEE
jgi:adenylate cyclase